MMLSKASTAGRLTLAACIHVDRNKPYPDPIDGAVLREPFGRTRARASVATSLLLVLRNDGRSAGTGRAQPALDGDFGDAGREHVLCPDLTARMRRARRSSPSDVYRYHERAPEVWCDATRARRLPGEALANAIPLPGCSLAIDRSFAEYGH